MLTHVHTCTQVMWDKSFEYIPEALNSLSVRVLLQYGIYTVAAPFWTLIAMKIKPRRWVVETMTMHACIFTGACNDDGMFQERPRHVCF